MVLAADPDAPKRYLVCYDIQRDAARARAAKVLSGFGTRVQFSVFECWLAPRELRRLKRALQRVAAAPADRIEVFECSIAGAAAGTALPADKPYRYWLA